MSIMYFEMTDKIYDRICVLIRDDFCHRFINNSDRL